MKPLILALALPVLLTGCAAYVGDAGPGYPGYYDGGYYAYGDPAVDVGFYSSDSGYYNRGGSYHHYDSGYHHNGGSSSTVAYHGASRSSGAQVAGVSRSGGGRSGGCH